MNYHFAQPIFLGPTLQLLLVLPGKFFVEARYEWPGAAKPWVNRNIISDQDIDRSIDKYDQQYNWGKNDNPKRVEGLHRSWPQVAIQLSVDSKHKKKR